MTDENTMAPCPFCGNADPKELSVLGPGGAYVKYNGTCSCGALGPDANTREEAIERWNRQEDSARVILDRIEEWAELSNETTVKRLLAGWGGHIYGNSEACPHCGACPLVIIATPSQQGSTDMIAVCSWCRQLIKPMAVTE